MGGGSSRLVVSAGAAAMMSAVRDWVVDLIAVIVAVSGVTIACVFVSEDPVEPKRDPVAAIADGIAIGDMFAVGGVIVRCVESPSSSEGLSIPCTVEIHDLHMNSPPVRRFCTSSFLNLSHL